MLGIVRCISTLEAVEEPAVSPPLDTPGFTAQHTLQKHVAVRTVSCSGPSLNSNQSQERAWRCQHRTSSKHRKASWLCNGGTVQPPCHCIVSCPCTCAASQAFLLCAANHFSVTPSFTSVALPCRILFTVRSFLHSAVSWLQRNPVWGQLVVSDLWKVLWRDWKFLFCSRAQLVALIV